MSIVSHSAPDILYGEFLELYRKLGHLKAETNALFMMPPSWDQKLLPVYEIRNVWQLVGAHATFSTEELSLLQGKVSRIKACNENIQAASDVISRSLTPARMKRGTASELASMKASLSRLESLKNDAEQQVASLKNQILEWRSKKSAHSTIKVQKTEDAASEKGLKWFTEFKTAYQQSVTQGLVTPPRMVAQSVKLAAFATVVHEHPDRFNDEVKKVVGFAVTNLGGLPFFPKNLSVWMEMNGIFIARAMPTNPSVVQSHPQALGNHSL